MKDYEETATKFLEETSTTMTVGEPTYGPHFVGETESRWNFPVKFRRNGRQFSVKFGQSIVAGAKEPTAYEVLACLTKYEPGSFHDFCYAFGYEEYTDYGRENRESRRIYNGVCREWEGVERLWRDCIETLQEIY